MYKITGLVYFFVHWIFTTGSDLTVLPVNIGRNLTIPCPIHRTRDVMWIREGRDGQRHSRMTILEDGSLFISQVDRNDSGVYSCSRENVVNSEIKARVEVKVRNQQFLWDFICGKISSGEIGNVSSPEDIESIDIRSIVDNELETPQMIQHTAQSCEAPPPALVNVFVRPSTILALLLWEVGGNGGFPIINFTAQYRLAYANESWIPISPNHITPNSRQIEVYKLVPNTTYQFRIWATNQLGRGVITEVYGKTLDIYDELELARHLLNGADKFDTRVWAVAVGIVMGTLILLGLGTCFLLYQECKVSRVVEEQEIIELIPNIILNPGFDPNTNTEQLPDENSNSETLVRLNNNTVVQPNNL